jgi:hypothetical protein
MLIYILTLSILYISKYVIQIINYENHQTFHPLTQVELIKEGSTLWKKSTTKYYVPINGVYLVVAKVECIILKPRPSKLG